MIKIEFKEAQNEEYIFGFARPAWLIRDFFNGSRIKSITPYIPTQDPMLDRSEILKQLGISQQEDEQNQIKWSKL